ncbi:hypothetical protein K437DRAFT_109794 [Tilletiaria anomala UBC 951]|uniref:N-acetyltransferase domain-containing protein n=1 Tax=Tilletiaria anomala (strain ATCC 24038 / CBS 436.72 / UBC 951) TaxID=1037660 RepID=A0A066VX62_TILAU|nr:uncharacterized protein K437DRAFT_109794 [Tilletiaria anomala UBC 951]KDN46312.1 hypothetical protein K437DRAFT_109794 [Tilletiaria anomala UBC 951]
MNPISLFPPPTSTISRNASTAQGGRHGGGAAGGSGGRNKTAAQGQGNGQDAAGGDSGDGSGLSAGGFLKRTRSGGFGSGSGGETFSSESAPKPGFRDRLNSARLSLTPHIRRANSINMLNAAAQTAAASAAKSTAAAATTKDHAEKGAATPGKSSRSPEALASNWENVVQTSASQPFQAQTSAVAQDVMLSPGSAEPSFPTGTLFLPGEEPTAEREAALQLRALPNASYAFVPSSSARNHISTSSSPKAKRNGSNSDKARIASISSVRGGGVGDMGASSPSSSSSSSAIAVSHVDTAALAAASALYAATSGLNSGKGASGKRLPMGLYFDYLKPDEIKLAHAMETESYEHGDAAPLERFRYRHNRAPHLFLGAFLPNKMVQGGETRHAAALPVEQLQSPKTASSASSDEGGPASGAAPSGGGLTNTAANNLTHVDGRTGSLFVSTGATSTAKQSAQPPSPLAAAEQGSASASERSRKEKRTLIGFVCATAAGAYTARAISLHDDSEDAHLVCMHSIVVGKIWRRRRIAKTMVDTFVQRIRDAELGKSTSDNQSAAMGGLGMPVIRKRGYETAAVIVHEELLPLMKACGFLVLGNSHVQYGSGDWIECRRHIVPQNMKKVVADGWAQDDAAQQLQDREEERQWLEKKSAERKEQAIAYIQSGAVPASGKADTRDSSDSETQLCLSPMHMDAPQLLPSGTLSPSPAATAGKSSRSNTGSSASTVHSDDAGGHVSAPSTGNNSLCTSTLLSALRQQSLSASQSSQRNPGQSFSAILGSALAGKTAHEDAFSALEARLVSRELGTNLADVYCPRAECGCKIMGVDRGMWEVREIGPLMSSDLNLPNSPAPPMHPSPPQPPAQARVSTANGPALPVTPGQAFWIVPTPLAFDNISFSRDAKWKPVPGAQVTSPRAENHVSGALPTTKEEKREQKEREKKEKAERKATLKAAKRQNSMTPSVSPPRGLSPQRSASPTWGELSDHLLDGGNDSAPEFTVKYLLCAECDCGPLGYSILPQSLTGGGLAHQVGQDINTSQGQQGQDGSDASPQRLRQEFLIAADRVRYRFSKH